MTEQGIIEEFNSPWSSPLVLVTKKGGSLQFCVDYRKLSDTTKKNSYPLSRIDDTLVTLSGLTWFSTLDLKSVYWQVGIYANGKEKTAFTASCGLYQFSVMPFDFTLLSLYLVYLVDVLVMRCEIKEHLKNMQEVFNSFRAAKSFKEVCTFPEACGISWSHCFGWEDTDQRLQD